MKTLIELYDERPLENVLSTEMFKPERTIFICDEEKAESSAQRKLKDYFRHRGIDTELVFVTAKHYSASSVLKTLRSVTDMYPDCAIDITGGTDDELFASGLLCAEKDIPVFTYSINRNSFYSIRKAPFPDAMKCTIEYKAEDFFRMAGGSMRSGRVDNAILKNYFDIIDPFFDIFMKNRRKWGDIVSYIQRVSQTPKEQPVRLIVKGDYNVKGDRGRRLIAPEATLRELEEIGMIKDLAIVPDTSVSFAFKDEQIRKWLRDVGSVLEIYMYKMLVDSGLFNDVHTSVVVDWEKNVNRDSVTNEIDVMAVRGVIPVFISCKTCAVGTEALNELAILRDRFGGKGARAAIVTSERGTAVMRNRARELDIAVFEQQDLISGGWKEKLSALMKR